MEEQGGFYVNLSAVKLLTIKSQTDLTPKFVKYIHVMNELVNSRNL